MTKSNPPPGAKSVLQFEIELTAFAAELERQARALFESEAAKGSARIGLATANQLAQSAIKAANAAAALALQREQHDHVKWLVAESRRMDGVDRGERPRMRRKADS